MQKIKLPYKIVAFDTETTGLDESVASIIQLGAVIINEDLSLDPKTFESYIKPLDDYRSLEAMQTNGISEETLKNAPPLDDVLRTFEIWTRGARVLGSWGTYFDVKMLKAQYKKIDRPYPFDWRDFDLKTVAMWELGKRGKATIKGVEQCLKQLGLEFEGNAHSALDDIKNSVRILKHCLENPWEKDIQEFDQSLATEGTRSSVGSVTSGRKTRSK